MKSDSLFESFWFFFLKKCERHYLSKSVTGVQKMALYLLMLFFNAI